MGHTLKNSLKGQLEGRQIEAFKKAIEDAKIGQQFLEKEDLISIFEEIQDTVKP